MKAIVKLIENEPFLIVDTLLESNNKLCEESLAWIKKYSPLSSEKGFVCEVQIKEVNLNNTVYSIYQVLNLHYLKYPNTQLFICTDVNSLNGMGVTEKESKATKFTLKVARALKEVILQDVEVVKVTY
jgi:hypothetical protein